MSRSVPVYELTEVDFNQHPVWQYRVDAEGESGIDESHAVPVSVALGLGTHGSFMVGANYRLANGNFLPGSVQVDIVGRKVFFTPSFLYVAGKSIDPLSSDAEERVTRITKQPMSRPTHWVLNVTFVGEHQPRGKRIIRSYFLQVLSLLGQLLWLRFVPRSRR